MSCSPALLNRSCLVKQTLLIKSHPSVISGCLKPQVSKLLNSMKKKRGGGVKNPRSPLSSLENTILSENLFLNEFQLTAFKKRADFWKQQISPCVICFCFDKAEKPPAGTRRHKVGVCHDVTH